MDAQDLENLDEGLTIKLQPIGRYTKVVHGLPISLKSTSYIGKEQSVHKLNI